MDCFLGMLLEIGVNHILQFLAWLEEGYFLGGNFHAVAGLGIASDARLTLTRAKAAEPAYLNLVARPQRSHDALEDGFDDDLAVLAGQFRKPGNLIDQVCLGHLVRPFLPPRNCSRKLYNGYSQILPDVGKCKF